MISDFVTLNDIETDVVSTCERIHKDIATFDDDRLICTMDEIAELALTVTDFANETDEWSLYESCHEYHNWLRLIFDALHSRLMSE